MPARDDDLVWVAARRRGIQAHDPRTVDVTGCGRSMRTGEWLTAGEAWRAYRRHLVPALLAVGQAIMSRLLAVLVDLARRATYRQLGRPHPRAAAGLAVMRDRCPQMYEPWAGDGRPS